MSNTMFKIECSNNNNVIFYYSSIIFIIAWPLKHNFVNYKLVSNRWYSYKSLRIHYCLFNFKSLIRGILAFHTIINSEVRWVLHLWVRMENLLCSKIYCCLIEDSVTVTMMDNLLAIILAIILVLLSNNKINSSPQELRT